MTTTLSQLQDAFRGLGYKWHPTFNLIGIRNRLDVPDAFNDQLICCWLQPALPKLEVSNILAQQKWLNTWFYTGLNGQPLKEDGLAGSNTNFALAYAARTAGTWRSKAWPITTDPGLYYLQNPLNPAIGCAIAKLGQYPNLWRLGFHQGKASHPALVQQGGPITVHLDNNRDKKADAAKSEKTGYFGINCHHASETIVSTVVGKWSAGCQVFPSKNNHNELLQLCRQVQPTLKNFFTYTLLHEDQL